MSHPCPTCSRTFTRPIWLREHAATCGRDWSPRAMSDAAAEHHAAADRSGLPQPRRHRGVTLPDGAPERWEVAGDG